jgi:Leucine-rich repeat (LRR) protein
MIRIKRAFLSFVFLSVVSGGYSQTIKGYTKDEIDEYSTKVEDQVRFLEYLFNTIGSKETSPRDKDVVIRESYLKIFRDGLVQVEDDLLLDRKVVTNKDVTSYLKDIEFFYKDINFKFKTRDVKAYQKDNGEVYFIVSLDRTITATGTKGEKVNNTKQRFVEVNLQDKSGELKIASIYTTKVSRDEELVEWWGTINPNWKSYFKTRFGLASYDSIGLDQLYKFVSVDSLDISGTDSLLDLSPMEAMRQLRFVNLSNTQITALGPISNVTFLEDLDVSNTPTVDIQFIKYSDKLKRLNISNTRITDIALLSNLKSLKTLEAKETPIMSFAVLNQFDSLQRLMLSQSGFNNAENISELNNLKELDLSNNYITNISALQGLKALTYLNLSNTNIKDLSSLAELNLLEFVDLTKTHISDITTLNGKEALRKVLVDETELPVVAADNYIRKNPGVLLIHHVKDLTSWWNTLSDNWKAALKKENPNLTSDMPSVEVLTQTIGLTELDLSDSGIETLNPITRFVKLAKVDFSGNPIQDLISLSEVKTLVEIVGKNTQVQNISPLRENEKLARLDLEKSPISSILDVIALPNLEYINVNSSAIFAEEVPEILLIKPSLTIVYRTTELQNWWESLDPSWKGIFKRQNSISDQPTVEELHRLTSLSELSFSSLSIGDISPVTAFANLRTLTVFDATIGNILPVAEMKLLENLTISQVPVVDFTPLRQLPKLVKLNISNTGIEDLDPLSSLINLTSLNISGTNLKSLKGLEPLINLQELDVASTNLRSLKQIEGLFNLKKLSCFNTRLNDRSIDNFKKVNPNCEVRFY